jgi:hypothetical protein
VAGAAACVPADLRVFGAVLVVVDDEGVVRAGGGAALTLGVFSHGGQGACHWPLPLGGEE